MRGLKTGLSRSIRYYKNEFSNLYTFPRAHLCPKTEEQTVGIQSNITNGHGNLKVTLQMGRVTKVTSQIGRVTKVTSQMGMVTKVTSQMGRVTQM